MNEKNEIFRRMVDVCFAIKAASYYDQFLSKIKLQKFIFFLDVIRPIYELMPPIENHITYKHGPYDVKIQNAADVLAFRGILKFQQLKTTNNLISINYSLTTAGEKWVNKLINHDFFSINWHICFDISAIINKLGWNRIISLAYSEPTYAYMRQKGYGQKIITYDATQNSAALIMEIIDFSLSSGFQNSIISNKFLCDLFFQYLDNVERTTHQNALHLDMENL